MTRSEYRNLRSTYRRLRREDANWRPDPFAAMNVEQQNPCLAYRLTRGLDAKLVETLHRNWPPYARGPHRLRITSDKIRKLRGPQHPGGYPLEKRVALRRARRQVEALNARQVAARAPRIDLVRFANGLLSGNQAEIAAGLGVAA